jgi:hypothetical protein
MKKIFQILRDRPKLSFSLTRDSVCAGDDCDAPHEKKITIHSFTDPKALARESSSTYLPSVDGVGHSWICVLNGIKIAEITHKGIEPIVRQIEFAENNKIHFQYISARY